jgi:hypothetical protein
MTKNITRRIGSKPAISHKNRALLARLVRLNSEGRGISYGHGFPWLDVYRALKEAGFKIVEGKKADGGYHAAVPGWGGYRIEVTPAREVLTVSHGCPAAVGEVAIKT